MKNINQNLMKINPDNENFRTLDSFKKFKCEKSTRGVITVILTDSGKRVRIDKSILEALGNPKQVATLYTENEMAICTCSAGDYGSLPIGKGGIIYSTELAEKIMEMNPNVDFKPNASTRCGNVLHAQVEGNETAVIVTF